MAAKAVFAALDAAIRGPRTLETFLTRSRFGRRVQGIERGIASAPSITGCAGCQPQGGVPGPGEGSPAILKRQLQRHHERRGDPRRSQDAEHGPLPSDCGYHVPASTVSEADCQASHEVVREQLDVRG